MGNLFFAILSVAVVVISTLFTSCSGSESGEKLAHAESIMDSMPDSALAILESIDFKNISSEKERALYALLLVQASYKNGIEFDDEKLIDESVNYYRHDGDDEKLMKILFYQGNVNRDKGKYSEAMSSAIKSHELAVEYGNTYWRAKTAELIADLFCYSYNYSEQIKWNTEAALYYKEAGKNSNHRFSLCDLAIGYHNDGNSLRAIQLIDSIKQIVSTQPSDSVLLVYCERASVPIYLSLDKLEDAYSSLSNLSGMSRYYDMSVADYLALAKIEFAHGSIDDFKSYLSIADSLNPDLSEKAEIWLSYAALYEREGNLSKALSCVDSILDIQNRVIGDIRNQPVVTTQRDYFSRMVDLEKEKSLILRIFLMAGILVAILTIAGIIIVYRLRMKLKNLEIDEKMNNIYFLTEQIKKNEENTSFLSSKLCEKEIELRKASESLSKKEGDVEALHSQIISSKFEIDELKKGIEQTILEEQKKFQRKEELLFKERWQTLNMLCNEYFEKGTSEKTRPLIVNNVESEIKKICGKKRLNELEQMVNKHMDNIVSKLREQGRILNDDEIKFMTFIYAGFSYRTVCILTNLGVKGFYSKKSRLINKINESDMPDKHLFVRKMRNEEE